MLAFLLVSEFVSEIHSEIEFLFYLRHRYRRGKAEHLAVINENSQRGGGGLPQCVHTWPYRPDDVDEGKRGSGIGLAMEIMMILPVIS